MESFEHIWDIVIDRLPEELEDIEPVVFYNCKAGKKYTVVSRLKNSLSSFKGVDCEGNFYFFKIIPCTSFSHVKSIYAASKKSSNSLLNEARVQILDIFEFYESNAWIVIIVSN